MRTPKQRLTANTREQYSLAYHRFRSIRWTENVIVANNVIRSQFPPSVASAVWESYLAASVIPGDFYLWKNPINRVKFLDRRWAS